ncbi:hypothetical protein WDU94_009001 [Cyamophila willieti]
MRTVTNYYIVNLAVADFLVILICLPPTVVWDVTETWFMGLVLCRVVLYSQVSVSNLMLFYSQYLPLLLLLHLFPNIFSITPGPGELLDPGQVVSWCLEILRFPGSRARIGPYGIVRLFFFYYTFSQI